MPPSYVYLYPGELSPGEAVGDGRQGGDRDHGQQTQGHDAQGDVDLHPPYILRHPGIFLFLLHLSRETPQS